MQSIPCPSPQTWLGATSSLNWRITHLRNTGLVLFPCPGSVQIQISLVLMQPFGLCQQRDLCYQAPGEQRGQGTHSKQCQKLPGRSDHQQLAPRWVTLHSAPGRDYHCSSRTCQKPPGARSSCSPWKQDTANRCRAVPAITACPKDWLVLQVLLCSF